jgi:hypothetical protein
MDRAGIGVFAARAAEMRASVFGVGVVFRGVSRTWAMEPPREETELSSGGHREKVEAVLRVPASVTPAPRRGESVTVVATGRVLRVAAVLQAAGNNPLAAEHLAELVAG